MLKFDFTDKEMEYLESKVHLTDLQKRIIKYRRNNEYSITQMAMLEHRSERTISREINKIKWKIIRVLW
jgi:IS30 family transposase